MASQPPRTRSGCSLFLLFILWTLLLSFGAIPTGSQTDVLKNVLCKLEPSGNRNAAPAFLMDKFNIWLLMLLWSCLGEDSGILTFQQSLPVPHGLNSQRIRRRRRRRAISTVEIGSIGPRYLERFGVPVHPTGSRESHCRRLCMTAATQVSTIPPLPAHRSW